MGNRDLAQVTSAKGFQVGAYLVLVIVGEKPTPCHEVDIELQPFDIFPPQFKATLTTDPLAICPDVVTPYERAEAFSVSDVAGKTVIIETGGGDVEVQVEAVAQQDDQPTARVSLDDVLGPPSEAVGYSDGYDLREAIMDAAEKLPNRASNIADWLYEYEVVSIGAEVGGIAGLDRLKVTVRG